MTAPGGVLAFQVPKVSGRPPLIWAAFISIVAVALAIDADVIRVLLTNRAYLGDFAVYWTAARIEPALAYDLEALTRARYWIVQQPGVAVFVNPPSTLPLLWPFGRLPFGPALGAWVGVGLAAYLWAASRMLTLREMPLLLLSPVIWVAAATGQLSLLVAAAMIGGVCALPKRPLLAGVLFAAAALIKPHMAIFVPLALMATKEWRALLSAMVSGLTVGLACVAVQGIDLWLAWLRAVQDFPAFVKRAGLLGSGLTPASTPVPEDLLPIIGALGVALGAVLVWLGFSRTEDRTYRLLALGVGAMLASPYGRKYDLAVIQPAIVLLLLNSRANLLTMIAAALGFILLRGPWGIIGLTVLALSGRTPGLRLGRRDADPNEVDLAEPLPASIRRPT